MRSKTSGNPHLPLRDAYRFLQRNGLGKQASRIRTSPVRVGNYTASVRRGMVIDLLAKRRLFERFAAKYWPIAASERLCRIAPYLVLLGRFKEINRRNTHARK